MRGVSSVSHSHQSYRTRFYRSKKNGKSNGFQFLTTVQDPKISCGLIQRSLHQILFAFHQILSPWIIHYFVICCRTIKKEEEEAKKKQRRMSLQVIYAAYGLKNVTEIVRQYVAGRGDTPSVPANNATLTDGWYGTHKTLVIVYRYGPTGAPLVAIATEGNSANITKPADIGHHNYGYSPEPILDILGAAYGPSNVTAEVNDMVQNNTLNFAASNGTFGGDPWKGTKKSFVIVYRYLPDTIFMDIRQEDETYTLTYRPQFSIISAYFANVDVTAQTRSMVSRRNLSINAVTFSSFNISDPLPHVVKSFVVLYSYGGGGYQMIITKEHTNCNIDFTELQPILPYTPGLQVVKAAYGLGDVSGTLSTLLSHTNAVGVNNATFTDTFQGQTKTFVAWYRFGPGIISTMAAVENATVTFPTAPPPNASVCLNDGASGFFSDGDQITIKSSAIESYWQPGATGQALTCTSQTVTQFTLRDIGRGKGFALQYNSSQYVGIGAEGNLIMVADTAHASTFSFYFLNEGAFALYVEGSGFCMLNTSSGNQVSSGCPDTFLLICNWEINFVVDDVSSHRLQAAAMVTEGVNDCDLSWMKFIWDLTGGFWLALGIPGIPITGNITPGLMQTLRGVPAIANFLDSLWRADVISIAVFSGIQFMKLLYDHSLLWTVLKPILGMAGMWTLGKIVAKILMWTFVPEIEAAELLASFVAWTITTTNDALTLANCLHD
jgi:hypothetical protein